MANHNSFIHNTGLNENNSLTHLLDTISPDMEDESNIIEQSKYYNDADFKDALQQYKNNFKNKNNFISEINDVSRSNINFLS